MTYRLKYFGLIYLFCMVIFLHGCGRPRGVIFEPLETPLVWPEPPDEPRIRYVGQISTEDDLKREVSWHEGLMRAVFGKEDIAVLVGPYSVVKDDDEKMFTADTGSGVVQVFDLLKREHSIFMDIEDGKKLITPVGLALAGENIYVADSTLAEVCVFEKSGRFLFSFGAGQLKRPTGLAYSKKLDRLYVSDTGNHQIVVYDSRGNYQHTIGKRGAGPGSFNFPTHLWIDQNQGLIVCDTLNYRVQIFSLEGVYMNSFGQHGDGPGSFAHPSGVATDSHGNIYVSDRKFENIQIFNSKGDILMAIGEEGSRPGQFWLPGGIFIDDMNKIFIADSYNNRIQVLEFIEESIR